MAEKSPPASTTTTEPVKTPAVVVTVPDDKEKLSPTRYGDWEKNGRCIDF